MADDEQTPEERRSPPPRKQPDPDQELATPRLTPQNLDESARQRLRATVAKQYPTAPEDEIERSREKGGEHPDVPPTNVLPPPTT